MTSTRSRIRLLISAVCWLSPLCVLAQSSPPPRRTPVLVELFTSEGCSDCPPADALLAELDAKQFAPGAEAIVMSEHVTYWNHLGWRDPFSLDTMTQRQEAYVRRFGLDSAYTPQAVVDGATQFVGSDGRAMLAAVSKAAAKPKMSLTIENARWDHGTVRFAVRAEMTKEQSSLPFSPPMQPTPKSGEERMPEERFITPRSCAC